MGNKKYRILISGGGTGGHIFPAVSIANAIKRRVDAEILFVGAENRMEMERVPEAGYNIKGLPVAGFNRKNLLKNISVLKKLYRSMRMARSIVKEFKPDIAVGVGGYASGPTLKAAQKLGVPTLIQEQNSYAGVTNKLLAKRAERICVAYDGMERFFPADKIVITGNPVRRNLLETTYSVEKARESFGLSGVQPTVLIVGGSLGARTLNLALERSLKKLVDSGYQVIWQTGKNFGDRGLKAAKGLRGVVVTQFISDMGAAYRAADLVVSRAGAGSISELQLLEKAVVLIPSPNVAEDHQTKNALALSDRGAAVFVPDAEAESQLVDRILELMKDTKRLETMRMEISKMAQVRSDERIVDEILKLI